MIIWLDGPFGVGKTTLARLLVERLGDAVLLDPERYGWLLQHTVGWIRPRDYQDLALWRTLTVRGVRRAARRHRHVVVAMSLPKPAVRAELFGAMGDVRHVLLTVSPAELRERIEADTADPGALDWRLQHCPAAHWPGPQPGTVALPTDGQGPGELVVRLLSTLGAG